jgi:hypothetical protein
MTCSPSCWLHKGKRWELSLVPHRKLGEVDQHIRWGVAPLGNRVRREVSHARYSSSLTLLDSTRHDARAAVCEIIELSLGAELIFLLHTEHLIESLTNAS